MIDIRELRLGNYVMYEQTTHVVTAISRTLIETHWSGGTENYIHLPDELDPIPLTEEVLLKCGFGRRGDRYYLIIRTGAATHSIYIEYIFSGDTGYGDMWIGKETANTKKIFMNAKYLHQLQNLFFVITGKELNYE